MGEGIQHGSGKDVAGFSKSNGKGFRDLIRETRFRLSG